MLLLDSKECIGNAKLIMCAELEEPLTIFIALADTCMPEADGPCPLVVPYSSIVTSTVRSGPWRPALRQSGPDL